MLLPTALIFGAIIAIVLIFFQVQFSRMGRHRVEYAIQQAEKQLEKGRLRASEKTLYDTLRINGWNYQSYLLGKKSNKALTIEEVVPGVTRIARTLKVLPKDNLEWVLTAFFLLGEIYLKQGKTRKAVRLYEDTLNFIDGYGQEIPFVTRNRYLSKIHYQQALIEQNTKNFMSSLRLALLAYVEEISHYKATGDDEAFNDHFPYDGDEMLDTNLKVLGRQEDRNAIIEIVNRAVRNSPGRINTQILLRDLDSFFSGTRRREDAELVATRDIIHRALPKAAGAEKTEKEEEKPDKEKAKSDVIPL